MNELPRDTEATVYYMEKKHPTNDEIHYAMGEAATHEMVIDVLLELVEQERQKRQAVLARIGMGHGTSTV